MIRHPRQLLFLKIRKAKGRAREIRDPQSGRLYSMNRFMEIGLENAIRCFIKNETVI